MGGVGLLRRLQRKFFLLMLMGLVLFGTVYAGYDGNGPDYGIYWFGDAKTGQKAVSGGVNPYFNPNMPTIIYIHGWQPNSTVSHYRETFAYEVDGTVYDLAETWLNRGWNVGIFYWNQFADELDVRNAEAKIWSAEGRYGMRWRKQDGSYSTAGVPPGKSVGDLLAEAYCQAMAGYRGNNVRIAGHSLGNQLAVALARMIYERAAAGEIPANLVPKRVALLDPFWSNGAKDYLNGRWTGEVVREYVGFLAERGVVFEQYKSSAILDLGIGDKNRDLEKKTAYTRIYPWYIPAVDVAGRHNAAKFIYFQSFQNPPPVELQLFHPGQLLPTGKAAASAATPDERIREMMETGGHWEQVKGLYTVATDDDRFLFVK